MDGVPASIQPHATNRKTEQEQPDITACQEDFGRAAEILPVVDEKPEDPGNAIREPRGKEGRDEGQEIVEVGDTVKL